MVTKIFRSFIPFLFILSGIFVAVIYLDGYAQKLSLEPFMVNIVADTATQTENIVHYVTDEIEASGNENILEADSIYKRACDLYRIEKYELAKKLFQQLSFKYENASIENKLGLIALKDGKYSMAQNHFKAAVEHDSTFQIAWINLAVASSRLHQNKRAETYYRKAKKLNPANPKPHYNLGLLLQGLGKWEQAAVELRNSIALSSGKEKALSLCYYGISLLNIGDTLLARDNFRKSIEYKPDYRLPRIHLALTNIDIEQRETELLKVYRLNTNSYYPNYYLGKMYAELNLPTKAEYHLRKALEINMKDEKIIEELTAFLIEQNRFDEAQLIISGFSVNDTLPQSYFQEARLASKKGAINDAIALYSLAIEKSDYDYPEAAVNQAILYKELNQTDNAIASYRAAIGMRENYATAYYNLALLYNDTGELETAKEFYKKAIQHDPKSSKSWYNLASIYETNGKTNEAIHAYKKAISAEPGYLKALSSLGVLYSKMGQYEIAIETYKNLLNKYPNYALAQYNLALAYSKNGQDDEAIETYEKVIEIDPENVKAKTNVGVLYAHKGDIDLAIKTFRNAVDEDVENPELRFNLALQYEKAGMYDEAAYQYTKAIQLNENYQKAYDNLINLYTERGDEANALVIKFNLMKRNPDGKIMYETAKELHDLNQYTHAISAYELAMENGAKKDWSTYWIGMVYMDMKEYDIAINYFKRVLELDDKHKFAYYRLGQVHELFGKPGEAKNYYQTLLELDPEFHIIYKNKEIAINIKQTKKNEG